ncbi:FtsX-like permease family protein [Cytobacillus sp. FJAT-54145]|uniref:FtsX-like permease family protein n=1 Tax=Cytobacillus spartinae TaxID=3299023 RepID=A0ABW6KCH8_9BACI
MNIVNKLTIRHLKQNKRRTLVTIIGVIISVSMIMAVSTLGISFLDLLKRQTVATEGEWHVLYQNINKEQLEVIQSDSDTEALVISRDKGFANLEGGQNENKPYLFIKEYNTEGFKRFPIELSKGRLPKAENEILLSEDIATIGKVNYEVGDTITLNVGHRSLKTSQGTVVELSPYDPLERDNGKVIEKLEAIEASNFKVVGFMKRPTWEPAWSPGYTVISYIDEKIIGANDYINASVVLKEIDRSLYDHAENLASAANIDSLFFNNGLLRYYGITNNDGLRSLLFSLSAVIMGVIIIGSVALIYNAFAISVAERSRHLGMLSSVGATKRQKRNSVFFEGAIIGLISIPIGIVCGLAGIGITFYFINSIIQGALGMTEKLTVSVTPLSLVVACAVSILTIFISTYLPARKASKITAIDAIRQTTEIKLTGKAVKTSKVVRKLFGIEAEIGLKNLKRNKRRYRVTVFSLVISIVLFLAVSFFTANLKKSLELSQDGVNFDIQVTFHEDIDHQLINKISSINDVSETVFSKELTLVSWIEESSIADQLKENTENNHSFLEDGKYPYNIRLHGLDEESLKAYAKEVGADSKQLLDPNQSAAIVIDTIPFEDLETEKYVETKVIHTEVGKSLELSYTDYETDEEKHVDKLEIAALTDKFPMGVMPMGLGALDVIVLDSVLEQYVKENTILSAQSFLYLKSADPMGTQREIEEMKQSNVSLYNVYQVRQQEEQMILLMSVFTYGFIVLITLISIANIFNTISTSISLRKREFAMLKSVGMTSKGFNKMMNYESIFYGLKSLLYGLPVSVLVMYLIHRSLMNSFNYGFSLPWLSILYVIVAVFIIVGSSMLYSISKVKKENIIDALKQESI